LALASERGLRWRENDSMAVLLDYLFLLSAVPSVAGSSRRSAAWRCRLQAGLVWHSLSPSWSLQQARSSRWCYLCRPEDHRCHPAAEERGLRWCWVAPVSTLAGSFSPAAAARAVLTAHKGSAQVLEPTEACLAGGGGPVRQGSLSVLFAQ